MSILTKILGDPNVKEIKRMQPLVDEINSLEKDFATLSDDQLKTKTGDFKKRLGQGSSIDDLLPEAFAMVREAAKRTIKQRHFDVQILAGLALHRGMVAEMKTGEGKTLAATLPLYLNALEGRGAHLVTVNDYLAARDTTWMGQIYHALGLSVGCIQQQGVSYLYDPNSKFEIRNSKKNQNSKSETINETVKVQIERENLREVPRKEAYQADITYGTNNEFGFDYLRDNMAQRLEDKVQRPLHYTIVDEVDSILIDEARTPLIISAPAQEATDMYLSFARLVPRLKEGTDYNVDEKMRAATLTEVGITKVERELGVDNLYVEGGIRLVHHLENALKAHALFKRDKDYVVRDGEVIIVDEFTGRLMFGRRYSDGLHQAIEAKEGVKIQQESVTMATITFQNYFRLYDKLAGMTGTAKTEEEELAKIYGLSVLEIPTNRPMIRNDRPDRVYKNEAGKFKAIIREIKERNQLGQPILVGTVSVEKNERLSLELKRASIKHEVLNAKNHEREAEIIAQAGRLGAVTIATNMAGRGVDIVLGGKPQDEEQAEAVKRLGGLYVIGTERHESRRIDNQLRGRSGRQGDPGVSQFYISMEDDLMRIFGSERMKNVMERLGVPDDMPIENKLISRSIESAQKKVEGHNFDIRKHLVEYDDVINRHREVIYKMRDEILSANVDKAQNKGRILDYIKNEIEEVVNFHTQSDNEDDWNLDEIYEVIDTIFPVPIEVRLKLEDIYEAVSKEKDGQQLKGREALIRYLIKLSEQEYDKLEEGFKAPSQSPPYPGGKAGEVFRRIEQAMLLRSIDALWVEHLDAMDHLRQGIGLRGYGQRDPLVEYKREAKRMFDQLLTSIRKQVVYSIFKVGQLAGSGVALTDQQVQNLRFTGAQKTASTATGQFKNVSTTTPQALGEQSSTIVSQPSAVERFVKQKEGVKDAPVMASNKIGRNDPCPCGSGKKYKRCGMLNTEEHQGLVSK